MSILLYITLRSLHTPKIRVNNAFVRKIVHIKHRPGYTLKFYEFVVIMSVFAHEASYTSFGMIFYTM